jgi:SAM-dependent methyltransferase
MDYTVRRTCRLCGGELELLLLLPDTPLANEYPRRRGDWQEKFPLYLSQCCDCRHVQMPVQVSPERLFSDYQYQSGTSPVFRAHLEELAVRVTRLLGGTDKRILEIGSNDGTLLRALADCGHYPLGIEPARNLANAASRAGLPTLCRFWPDFTGEKPPGEQDAVIALNVYAHVADMDGFTAAVKRVLKRGGWFIFEVGYLRDVVERGHFDVIYHEHLDYHQLRSLDPFLRRHGLYLRDVERNESQGGTIRCFASTEDGEQSESLKRLLAEEKVALNQEALFNFWVDTRTARDEIAQAIYTASQRGPVDGYGCPAKLTTLAYACGLGQHRIRRIYEDNSLKVGRYTPGTHIPIVGTEKLYRAPPETLVIFAWNFAEDIMRRCRENGFDGTFIVPMPKVQVIS